MTAHVHDPAAHRGGSPAHHSAGSASTTSVRPRWLLPGLLITFVAGGLIFLGILSLSTVLYAGVFGGMILMHAGGHGHGGHVSAGHAAHSGETGRAEELSGGSSDTQPPRPGSVARLGERPTSDSTTSEIEHDDQHSEHGCH